MKKEVLFVLIILFLSQNVISQWYIQNISTQPRSYTVTNDGKIFLIQNGIIYSSSNAGQSWIKIYVNYEPILSSTFIDSITGFCFTSPYGGGNKFYKTTDGGKNWSFKSSNYQYPVSFLFFRDSNNGYGCWGGNFVSGRIINTTDGGLTWHELYYSDKGITSVYMLNNSTGFATGFDSLLYTSNGGTTWTPKFRGYALSKVIFLNNSTGFVLSQNYTLYRTTNIGVNWSAINLTEIGNMPNDFYFANVLTGWMGVGSGNIYKSTNGGVNWYIQRNYNGGDPYDNIRSIAFLNPNTGFAGVLNGKILKTTNSGVNWNYFFEPFNETNKGVSFININTGFLITNSGNIYKTTNKGGNWNNIYACGVPLYSIYTDSINGVFVSGASGKLFRSNNFGNNWSQVTLANSSLKFIKFVNYNTGIICGDSGIIFKSTNNGNNWSLIYSPIHLNLNSVSIVNNTMWTCGDNGVMLKSTDSGNNWFLSTYFSAVTYSYGIHFLNEQTGYVINYIAAGYPNLPAYSSIYSTTNGGSNWVLNYQYSIYGNIAPRMTSIKFYNQVTGYVTADNGDLLRTTNGGINFSLVQNLFNIPLYSSAFTNNNAMWLVGSSGLVISSYDVNVGIHKTEKLIPESYNLFQNYPNPFNASTKIKFEIPKVSLVKLSIYNINGRLMETVVNQYFDAGKYELSWNANKYPTGIYFCKFNSGNNSKVIKMVLLK